jgi:hypothetical protein
LASSSSAVELVDYEVTTSILGPLVIDDDSSFRERQGVPSDPSGGIEDAFAEWRVGEQSTLEFKGRGVIDAHDYLAAFSLEDTKRGKAQAGYREFRTWYDGSGGFFPQNGAFLDTFADGMATDRGEAWFDGTLALPDLPELRLRYRYDFRDGRRPLQAWGETNATGGFGPRSIVNAFSRLDEKRNSVAVDLRHGISTSKIGAGFRYERPDIDDSNNLSQNPGEAGLERFVTQKNANTTNLYNAHAFSEHPFLDRRLLLTTAYAYTDVDSNIGGFRRFGATLAPPFDPTFANRQAFDAGFLDLEGDGNVQRHVGGMNLIGRPRADTSVRAAVRLEQEDVEGASAFTETLVGAAPGRVTATTPLSVISHLDQSVLAEDLEVRFTGIERVSMYARAEWEQGEHDVRETETDTIAAATVLDRKTNIDRFAQTYGAGANWMPASRVNLTSRYSYRALDDDFANRIDSTSNVGGNRYPAYITAENRAGHRAEARLTLRPASELRLGLGYDFRYDRFDTAVDGFRELTTGRTRSHMIGSDATWNPTASTYVQTGVNYVRSRTETPAQSLTGPATRLVPDFKNDYVTTELGGGWAVSEAIDLEARYVFLYADDYVNNSAESQPYGTSLAEHGATLGLTYHVNERLRWSARYGYFNSNDSTNGGHDSYQAHLLMGSVQVKY